MTTELRSSVGVELGWTWRDRLGTSSITDSNRLPFARDLSDGSGANQADVVWHAHDQSLAAGESITLYLGALAQGLFGDTITLQLARVKALLIVNRSAVGDGYLVVGGAGVNEWCAPFGMLGDTVKVMPDSPLLLANVRDGWDVGVDSEALRITAAGGTVVFDVAILGTSQGGSGDSSSGESSSSGS